METSLKTGFAQIFSCCPKKLSCPKFGGAAAPLAPSARTPLTKWKVIVPFYENDLPETFILRRSRTRLLTDNSYKCLHYDKRSSSQTTARRP